MRIPDARDRTEAHGGKETTGQTPMSDLPDNSDESNPPIFKPTREQMIVFWVLFVSLLGVYFIVCLTAVR